MPRITEYTAPQKQLNPSDRAQQAWETAGRRVGPLYNQAAQDIKQAGVVQGQMERDKIWPFDIAALYEHNAPTVRNTTANETTSRSEAGHATLVGGISEAAYQGASGGVIDPRAYPGSGYTTAQDIENRQVAAQIAGVGATRAHGEASAGGAALSGMARAYAAARGYTEKEVTDRHGPMNITDFEADMGQEKWAGEQRAEADYQQRKAEHAQAMQEHQDNLARAAQDRAERLKDKWDRQVAIQRKANGQYFDDFNRRRDAAVFEQNNPGMTVSGRFDYTQPGRVAQEAWQSGYADFQKGIDQNIAGYNKDQMKAAKEAGTDFTPLSASDPQVRQKFGASASTRPTGYQAPPSTPNDGSSSNAGSGLGGWLAGQVNQIDAQIPLRGAFSPSNVTDAVSKLKDTLGGMFGDETEEERLLRLQQGR